MTGTPHIGVQDKMGKALDDSTSLPTPQFPFHCTASICNSTENVNLTRIEANNKGRLSRGMIIVYIEIGVCGVQQQKTHSSLLSRWFSACNCGDSRQLSKPRWNAQGQGAENGQHFCNEYEMTPCGNCIAHRRALTHVIVEIENWRWQI